MTELMKKLNALLDALRGEVKGIRLAIEIVKETRKGGV